MFGKKAQAPAVVVDVEERGRGMTAGDVRRRFALEVRPADAPAFRVMVDHTFLWSDPIPGEGTTVTVEYEAKHPDRAELKMDGDPRYDRKLVKELRHQQESARESALDAELTAPPGTPPPTEAI
jgi:hypothetical protein